MNNLKFRIAAALDEVAKTDIPDAIHHVSDLDDPDDMYFALTDLRKKLASVDSRIFNQRFRELRP